MKKLIFIIPIVFMGYNLKAQDANDMLITLGYSVSSGDIDEYYLFAAGLQLDYDYYITDLLFVGTNVGYSKVQYDTVNYSLTPLIFTINYAFQQSRNFQYYIGMGAGAFISSGFNNDEPTKTAFGLAPEFGLNIQLRPHIAICTKVRYHKTFGEEFSYKYIWGSLGVALLLPHD